MKEELEEAVDDGRGKHYYSVLGLCIASNATSQLTKLNHFLELCFQDNMVDD
jgi:hypothetical protein